jgi:hypothetical protein
MKGISRAYSEYSAALEQDGAAAYTATIEWAGTHVSNSLELSPFDPEANPFQLLEIVVLDAEPDLVLAHRLGEGSVGVATYAKLLHDLTRNGLVKALNAKARDAENPQSSIFVTPHKDSIFDTAITHNAFFVADNDESAANHNVIVLNHMLKFLKLRTPIGSIAVPTALRTAGKVVFGWPQEGAEAHGVPQSVSVAGNKVFAFEYNDIAAKGAVVHRALSDTRAREKTMPDGRVVKWIPRVDEGVAKIARKRTPTAIAVAVNTTDKYAIARISPAVELKSNDDVHRLMYSLAESTGDLSHEEVVYGEPDA